MQLIFRRKMKQARIVERRGVELVAEVASEFITG
jgi:hypothetical protein